MYHIVTSLPDISVNPYSYDKRPKSFWKIWNAASLMDLFPAVLMLNIALWPYPQVFTVSISERKSVAKAYVE